MEKVNVSEIISTLSKEQIEKLIENYLSTPEREKLLSALRHFLNEIE